MTRARPSFLAAAVLTGLLAVEGGSQVLFRLKHGRWPAAFAREQFDQPAHHYMSDHPYLPYFALPGEYGPVRINSWGGRGPEPERPKRRIRILCFGGSTTFDMAHPLEDTWPGRLQKMLGPRYEVVNAAQNGATSADTLVNYALLQSELKPDLVLALEGVNDLESSFFTGFRPDYAHRRRKIPDEPYPIFRALPRWLDYSAFWVSLRWALVGPRGELHALYSRPGWYDFEHGPFGLSVFRRNLRMLNALVRLDGARLILGTPGFYEPDARARFGEAFADSWKRALAAENETVRDLARREGVGLAELERSYVPTSREHLDFCHFTEAGNELVARAFHKAVLAARR